ncbi:MAG TPA: ATP-dependent Clp protease proteolytic subunit [Candidatus Pacearchaeota archaeon]|nr:ATP-dependent Clp protease proteolytic subunit [Candidatus Pacearchaeota archaeon]
MGFISTPVKQTMQLTKVISTDSASSFFSQFIRIIDLAKKEKKEKVVTIQICCGGGSVSVALGFADLICWAAKDVIVQTVGIGHVGSAAIPVLMAGIKRYITPHCEIYVHNTRFVSQVKMNLLERKNAKQRFKKSTASYDDFVVECSKGKLSVEAFKKLCNSASCIFGQDAINYGFADEIL